MIALVAIGLSSCTDSEDGVQLCKVTVQLVYPDNTVSPYAGVTVQLKDASASVTEGTTDASGIVEFSVPAGLYEISSSSTYQTNDYLCYFNGVKSNVVVSQNAETQVNLELTKSYNSSSVIIKELYNGGCPKDDGGTSFFQMDKSFILYNNSAKAAMLENLAFGFAGPYNAEASNGWYTNGTLSYASEDYIPALNGIWYFQNSVIIEPYSQIVVNCMGAIDNTKTYSQSVNYANADYYTMYDPDAGYTNTSYYPTPSDAINTSHYLKAVKYGLGNAWPLSVTSPAVFIFSTGDDTTPVAYAADNSNIVYEPGKAQTAVNANLKVKKDWILDGMEVYTSTAIDQSSKRLTSDIDAGYVALTNKLGYVLYRNVNKDATEALAENSGKLVYSYSQGVGSSTDPSGIDAEASIKNGAHIIYMDTNNSTSDFHERQKSSLRE